MKPLSDNHATLSNPISTDQPSKHKNSLAAFQLHRPAIVPPHSGQRPFFTLFALTVYPTRSISIAPQL